MKTGADSRTVCSKQYFDSGFACSSLPGRIRREDTMMKNGRKLVWLFVQFLAVAALLFIVAPRLRAQADAPPAIGDADDNFNPPPCDFNDGFYNNNGISTSNLGSTAATAQGVDSVPAQRFGLFRQTGPPAFLPGQVNWVIDNTCATRDAIRNNVRILATTGGYVDDGTGSPTDFISLIAFITNQNFFLQNFVSGDPSADCTVPTPPNLPNSGCVVISNSLNARNQPGDDMFDLVSNFEAYPALKQLLPNGTFAPVPCGSLDTLANNPNTLNPGLPFNPPSNCFPVTSIATPQLRQDWRFATNRNAIDGSDNNNVQGSGNTGVIVNNSPFGYFCDDLLGIWINTYWWFTQDPRVNGPCSQIYANIAAVEGTSLDGTPIVKTAFELNQQLEANGCGQEGKLDFGGADGGAVWLICPAIPDPRAGAISLDAFLDQVHRPNGFPLDINFTINFLSLQIFGVFPNELTAAQLKQVQSAAASSSSSQ